MKKIAVFCGSSSGKNEIYSNEAYNLGQKLANRNIELIYGGGGIGLMGRLADGAIQAGGKVTGVIPAFLNSKEIAHPGLSELISVETMHIRKALIYEMCDGAIALPGGFGTLDEMFELITWGQLGLHPKPVALLNINGYYNDLIKMVDKMFEEGFIKNINREMLLVSKEVDSLLNKMINYKAPDVPKWIK